MPINLNFGVDYLKCVESLILMETSNEAPKIIFTSQR